ncbi:MAG: 4Fe-4S dicluster domain-containing protein [Cytophagales bacterium]|nr:MAG: 4Fe-4S dicluster domain-containing protein [Cytophagales bacterium]
MSYFQDIQDGIRTTLAGLRITMRHLRQATERRKPLAVANDNYFELQTGLVTVQYPHEQLPIPDNGRYRLHNEIEDCIVCDKCAKVCPVDCITIDAVKATEEIGKASDGSPIRLYAATFDIDMAKCCYCGLCTVVCPTECLTMEKKFDYSEFELGKLTYGFANLTPDEAEEKRILYEQFVAEKAAQKAQQVAKPTAPASVPVPKTDESQTIAPAAPKVGRNPGPVFRPTAKPKPAEKVTMATDTPGVAPVHAEVDRPAAEASPAVVMSGTDPQTQEEHTVQPTAAEEAKPVPAKPKAPFRPTMKPKLADSEAAAPNPAIEQKLEESKAELPEEPAPPKPKPAFRPTMKPKNP